MKTRDEAIQAGMESIRASEMESLGAAYDSGVEAGDQAGYERGKAEGASGEDSTPYDQAYVDARVSEATVALEAKINDLELEEEADKEVKKAAAEQLRALADKFAAIVP